MRVRKEQILTNICIGSAGKSAYFARFLKKAHFAMFVIFMFLKLQKISTALWLYCTIWLQPGCQAPSFGSNHLGSVQTNASLKMCVATINPMTTPQVKILNDVTSSPNYLLGRHLHLFRHKDSISIAGHSLTSLDE